MKDLRRPLQLVALFLSGVLAGQAADFALIVEKNHALSYWTDQMALSNRRNRLAIRVAHEALDTCGRAPPPIRHAPTTPNPTQGEDPND